MEGEIVNRVAKSPLKTLDLEAWYPRGPRFAIDISQWLDEGIILREQAFREALKTHDWSRYRDAYVALLCTTDAIVPVWAYMLISTYLSPLAARVVAGSEAELETVVFRESLDGLDLEEFRDKPMIIKGCSNVPVPPSAYVDALERLHTVARAVHYGEACSSVPVFRRK